ncbi:uncharacterized protein [Venturia canescens]|uniref:uncharacterized protein n=1 Tax=Venturia canescens TaxID=32260 RepID=UPI001C9C5F78|nr:uncharacterized protein LOC122408362 [Venturia canescens]
MSPLNRGPPLGPRMPPVGMRPPLPRFGGRPPIPLRMARPPGRPPLFAPMRQRMMPPRPRPPMMGPNGPPPLFGPRGRGVPPLMPPIMGPRVMGPRGPIIRPGPRGILPPQGLPHMRPRFPMGNGNIKMKAINIAKKVIKLEELEMKKPWMTDEIRNEIQKKNKLYAKGRKNKDAKEWEEFKDLRNKVTRMIRDAKNEYLAKNPEQAHLYEDDNEEPYDQRDETYTSSEDDIDEDDPSSRYCEVCDREFETSDLLRRHVETHTTCDIDGCTFSAHPKLVEKHVQMQHRTGLYHRIKHISTPEDIEKWIMERKKKYPTKAVVEAKKAERLEKIERGEIIERQKNDRELKKPVRERRRKTRKRRTKESVVETEPEVQLYRGLRPFSGTAKLREIVDENEDEEPEIEQMEDDEFLHVTCQISDDEDENVPVQCSESLPPTPEKPQKENILVENKVSPVIENKSGLASLMASYGSDSEEDEAPEEIPIKRLKVEIPPASEAPKVQESLEQATISEPKIAEKKLEVKVKNRKNSTRKSEKPLRKEQPRNINNNNGHYSQKRLMLLQRLLSRSIQHERNLICQCIKYIADNNFFEE